MNRGQAVAEFYEHLADWWFATATDDMEESA